MTLQLQQSMQTASQPLSDCWMLVYKETSRPQVPYDRSQHCNAVTRFEEEKKMRPHYVVLKKAPIASMQTRVICLILHTLSRKTNNAKGMSLGYNNYFHTGYDILSDRLQRRMGGIFFCSFKVWNNVPCSIYKCVILCI